LRNLSTDIFRSPHCFDKSFPENDHLPEGGKGTTASPLGRGRQECSSRFPKSKASNPSLAHLMAFIIARHMAFSSWRSSFLSFSPFAARAAAGFSGCVFAARQ
jgi:hypothetical protein